MGNALKIENLNPLNHSILTRRILKNNPRLKRRTDEIWDEGITGKRARRAIVPKLAGKNYEPLF